MIITTFSVQKLKLEEIDPEDADRNSGMEALEDGLYTIKDGDYLEDAPEEVREYGSRILSVFQEAGEDILL